MRIYVINLKRRSDRLEKIVKLFSSYNFDNYEIIDAVDGNDLTRHDIDLIYNKKHGERLYRELSIAEIATAMSHKKAYMSILESKDEGAIIIEDDVKIDQRIIDYANSPHPKIDCDCLLLSYSSTNKSDSRAPEYKDQLYRYDIMDDNGSRVYFKNTFIESSGYRYYEFDDQSTKVDFIHGAFCYYITKDGCDRLIDKNTPVLLEADNIWNFNPDVKIYGIRPMIVQHDFSFHSDIQSERDAYQKTKLHSSYLKRRKNNPSYGT